MTQKREIRALARAAQSAVERLSEAVRLCIDDRPDAWLDSDAGAAWQDWMDRIEDASAAVSPDEVP